MSALQARRWIGVDFPQRKLTERQHLESKPVPRKAALEARIAAEKSAIHNPITGTWANAREAAYEYGAAWTIDSETKEVRS